jgi:protein-tyrosine phosphatase
MIQSILIICVGNICRSPAAEKIFRGQLSDQFTVSSAGVNAVLNQPIDPNMQKCLFNAGYIDLSHRARQFTLEMANQADLILAMEKSHIHRINETAPQAYGKTMLMGKWAGDLEVLDPYGRDPSFFDQTYANIDRYVGDWVDKLQ